MVEAGRRDRLPHLLATIAVETQKGEHSVHVQQRVVQLTSEPCESLRPQDLAFEFAHLCWSSGEQCKLG